MNFIRILITAVVLTLIFFGQDLCNYIDGLLVPLEPNFTLGGMNQITPLSGLFGFALMLSVKIPIELEKLNFAEIWFSLGCGLFAGNAMVVFSEMLFKNAGILLLYVLPVLAVVISIVCSYYFMLGIKKSV